MASGPKRLLDQRCVTRRWRADVHEVERFIGEQRLDAVVPSPVRTGCPKYIPASSKRIGCGHDPDILARSPAGQMPFLGNVAESDKRAPQHAPAQFSPNFCAIAPKASSRISTPLSASSSVMTSGGFR